MDSAAPFAGRVVFVFLVEGPMVQRMTVPAAREAEGSSELRKVRFGSGADLAMGGAKGLWLFAPAAWRVGVCSLLLPVGRLFRSR